MIIDDEDTGITTLRFLIEKHIPEIRVVAECNRARDGVSIIEDYMPEIVFLDISMPELDGFQVLEKLEWKDFSLIFTTAHREHALKALRQNAFDYLLKPIYHKELRSTIDRISAKQESRQATIRDYDFGALEDICRSRLARIGIPSKDGVEYVEPADLIFLHSQANYTSIRLKNGTDLLTTRRLGEFETLLCSAQANFLRVHNSYIINLHKVSRYIRETELIVMTDQEKIPLSKSRRDDFFKWLEK